MYYIPAGLFALQNPVYAQLAAAEGADVSLLTWGNFVFRNLLPVTLGNIIGGAALGVLLWYCFLCKKEA
jgi:formate/nitrite transporter FocA (FNT family)